VISHYHPSPATTGCGSLSYFSGFDDFEPNIGPSRFKIWGSIVDVCRNNAEGPKRITTRMILAEIQGSRGKLAVRKVKIWAMRAVINQELLFPLGTYDLHIFFMRLHAIRSYRVTSRRFCFFEPIYLSPEGSLRL